MCFFNQTKNSAHQDTTKKLKKQVTDEDGFLTHIADQMSEEHIQGEEII